jgi:hypothetical protein
MVVLALFTLFFQGPAAHADTLFEGYNKLTLAKEHIGYIITNYSFDPKKQEFTATEYLKSAPPGNNVTESIKARADAKLKPLSFQYTSLVENQVKTIDATFKNGEMTATVKEGGKTHTVRQKLKPSSILSIFLPYVLLQGKKGLSIGVDYTYSAIAEEDATLNDGEAFIKEKQKLNGLDTFKVLNKFKGEDFFSFVTDKGEVVSTQSPTKQISTELVAESKEATGKIPVTPSTIELLFGHMPTGKENIVAKQAASPATAPAASPALVK